MPCGCHHRHQFPLAPGGAGLAGGVDAANQPPRGEGDSANTQTGSTNPPPVRAWGSGELSPSPSRLLGLEIKELLLIGCRPRTRPRTRGAPLSVLLTGEMSKPVVTVTL